MIAFIVTQLMELLEVAGSRHESHLQGLVLLHSQICADQSVSICTEHLNAECGVPARLAINTRHVFRHWGLWIQGSYHLR